MNTKDKQRYDFLEGKLILLNDELSLIGIQNSKSLDTFIRQIIDSIRRVEYVYVISERNIDVQCTDPNSPYFDPIKAAIYYRNNNNIDEAFWLIFLAINYGKHKEHEWRMAAEIYGRLGSGEVWTWEKTSMNPQSFSDWITDNYPNIFRAFGNHRKFESLRPNSPRPPAKVVTSYIRWVGNNNSHVSLINQFDIESDSDKRHMFSKMYSSMSSVVSFGRTSKFDFLTMIAKTGLADISPDLTYMKGATGPYTGANLLFTGSKASKVSAAELERNLVILDKKLELGDMGMQILEDSLCNWQKTPQKYKRFKG